VNTLNKIYSTNISS